MVASDKSLRSNGSTENVQVAAEKVPERNSANEIRNKYLMKLQHHKVWLAPI